MDAPRRAAGAVYQRPTAQQPASSQGAYHGKIADRMAARQLSRPGARNSLSTGHRRRGALPRARSTAWLLLCLVVVPLLPGCSGCSGCRGDGLTEEEREAKREELRKKEKPKDPYELLRFSTQPGALERIEAGIKPGHWATASLETRANNADFRGELEIQVVNQGRPVDLDQMPFRLRTSRPAILAKGQKRILDFPIFAPEQAPRAQLLIRLLTGPGGRLQIEGGQPLQLMPAHQYYFVVLAGNPDSYQYLSSLDSVRAPTSAFVDELRQPHYRVVLPKIRNRTPLPISALSWTSIAYVLWDDLNPNKLLPDQQQALLDWLHWGGQILISGPGTLEGLRGSFLEPYLPAQGGESWQLTATELEAMNQQWTWTLTDRRLKGVQPWSAQRLIPHAAARVIVSAGDEPLVVERQIGRGRVVATAFQLNQRELRNWPSFDGFFNACLLRRPAREFSEGPELALQVQWLEGGQYDPRLISRLRYYSRDAEAPPKLFDNFRRARPAPQVPERGSIGFESLISDGYDPFIEEGPPAGRGVAGWNDFSSVSDLAFATLREAAGIEVPDAMFVVWVLVAYVAVLVPLNWAFFSLLGRVEWAWAAAPVISLGCSICVVWLAQLDIGFARSQTQLAVIELHKNYPRAHLTRYTALYSSLGTRYDLRFDDASAVALPFPTGHEMLAGQGRSLVDYRRARQVEGEGDESEISQATLTGLEISSNTTGMVHSEEMFELGGGVDWEHLGGKRYRLTNGTMLALRGAGIVGTSEAAWIGTLEPTASKVVELRPRKDLDFITDELGNRLGGTNGASLFADELDQSPLTSRRPPADGFHLHHLMVLAQHELAPGELRLVAWTDEELPGMTIEPAASQLRRLGLVVAHLEFPAPAPPERDANARAHVQKQAEAPLPAVESPDGGS